MESYKNVYTAEEYKRLAELKDAAIEQNKLLNNKLEQAMADISKHGQTIASLEQERAALLWQIERTVDEQKVELPRKVAEAIESCRTAGMSNMSIIKSLDVIPQLFRDYDSTVQSALIVILDFSRKLTAQDCLLDALVNGYTIEKTRDDRLREKMEEAYETWSETPSHGPDEFAQDRNELIDLMTAAVKQIYQTETTS